MTYAATVSPFSSASDLSLKGILSSLGFDRNRATAARPAVVRHSTDTRPLTAMVEYGPKSTIFMEGDGADTVFEVIEGVVILYKLLIDGRRQVTGFVYPGELFGLSGRETYSYSAQSTGKVRLLTIARRRFENACSDEPKLEKRLFDVVGEDLRRAQEHILLLGRKSAKEKLCSFLLTFAQQMAARADSIDVVHLPMTRGDIADFLGLTIETVCRTIADLKAQRIIKLRSTEDVEILDMVALIDYSEGDVSPV